MKKAIITGPRQAEIVEAPDPQPKAHWAVVKIYAAPLCTEYKAWLAGTPTAYLGHEAAGEVVAVAQPCRVRVGERVVVMPQHPCGTCALCRAGDYIYCEQNYDFAAVHGTLEGSGTLAQYVLKQDWLLLPIPEGISYEHASLACCALGPSFGALEAMHVGAFDTLLIVGLGPVGLGAVVNAFYRGARVIAVEAAPWRIEWARQMGVEYLFDPNEETILARLRELTAGRGVDAALDCTGAVAAQRLCLEATRRRGRVAFIGEGNDPLPIRVSDDLIRKGLTLYGSWHYNLADFPKIMQIIQHSPLIEQLISHVLPLSRIQEALALCARRETAKVVLQPWADEEDEA